MGAKGRAGWSSQSLSSHLYNRCDPDTASWGLCGHSLARMSQQGSTLGTIAVIVVVCIPSSSTGASVVAQSVKNPLQCGRPGFDPSVGKIPWRRERPSTSVFWPGKFHELYRPWGRKQSDTS